MGNAVKNNVTLDGTNGAIFQTAYGGYTKNGTVSKNTMTVKNIDDSTAGLINTGTLAGGYTANGNAENNTVTMTDNANVTFNIYGGESGKGNVTGNVVTMTNTKLDPTGGLANAYGGYTAAGTASVNEVHVNNGSYASSAYGGYTVNGDAINNTATASYTTLPNLIGGYVNGTGNASSNTAPWKTVPSLVSSAGGLMWVMSRATKSPRRTRRPRCYMAAVPIQQCRWKYCKHDWRRQHGGPFRCRRRL